MNDGVDDGVDDGDDDDDNNDNDYDDVGDVMLNIDACEGHVPTSRCGLSADQGARSPGAQQAFSGVTSTVQDLLRWPKIIHVGYFAV